jgi:hypothetical protein
MLEIGNRFEEPAHFGNAQHDRELVSNPSVRNPFDHVLASERDVEEEPQGADRLIEVSPGNLLAFDENDLVLANLLRPEQIGRLPKCLAKVATART